MPRPKHKIFNGGRTRHPQDKGPSTIAGNPSRSVRPVISRMQLSREALLASICRDSFIDFFVNFWSTYNPGTKLRVNWHMEYIADRVQVASEKVFANEPKEADLVINVPPGTTKSSLLSISHAPWTWTRLPNARHICASFSEKPVAMDLSRKSRDVIRSSLYNRLFPEIQVREDLGGKGFFGNTLGGSRIAVGIGGSVTGLHAHFLTIDDPLDPKAAGRLSEADVVSANNWMNETIPSRKVDKEVSLTMIVMQRLKQNDPTGNRLEQAAKVPVEHICLPADISEGYPVVPKKLKKFYINGLLDPVRLPKKVLEEQELILGPFGYAGQYGQQPVPRQGGTFLVDMFGTPVEHPSLETLVRVCRFWDKAGTKDDGAYTVGCLVSYREYPDPSGGPKLKEWYVLHVVRFRYDSAKREGVIRNTTAADMAKYGRKYEVGLEQEPGSGGKESAENTARMLCGAVVKVDKPTGEKAERADPLSTQVNAGAVRLVRGDWNNTFIEEGRHYPHGKRKDQIDAAAGAFNQLNKAPNFVGFF